jgi:hypothetical protein
MNIVKLVCDGTLNGSGQNPVTAYFGHDNDHSDSIKGGEFYEQLSDHHLPKKILLHTII